MFQFKQFTIRQSDCAIKVGTDGVLLGAWADTDGATNILDIGSGTGVIALMLAQRTENATITGIEIDEKSVLQSNENAKNSPWSDRVRFVHADFRHHLFERKFDLIVSNPPYFSNSLKNPDERKRATRHDDTLTQETLAARIAELLDENGKACVIYPTTEGERFILTAEKHGLHCTKKMNIHPQIGMPAKRLLLQFEREETPFVSGDIAIEKAQRHDYTDEYIALTKDFYLKF